MPTALESRLNASVMSRLANARGDFGAADFPIVFENGYVDTGTGVTALKPLATVEDTHLAAVTPNQAQRLRVNAATNYIVRDILPDGAGMSQLVLEKA